MIKEKKTMKIVEVKSFKHYKQQTDFITQNSKIELEFKQPKTH